MLRRISNVLVLLVFFACMSLNAVEGAGAEEGKETPDRLKLAVFPVVLKNTVAQWMGDAEMTDIFKNALTKVLQSEDMFQPSFSYYDLEGVETQIIGNDTLDKNAVANLWQNGISRSEKQPNVDLICELGEKLQVDAVLTGYARSYSQDNELLGDLTVALVSVKTKTSYLQRQTCPLRFGLDSRFRNIFDRLHAELEENESIQTKAAPVSLAVAPENKTPPAEPVQSATDRVEPAAADGADLYRRCLSLYLHEDYEQIISLLSGYCSANPADKKSELLLAKAYLGKCESLKREGSESYKIWVMKPYEIGKKIHLDRDEHLPEALFVCGKSFYINERAVRAIKYIKKAIRLSPSPPAEYYIVVGDANFSLGVGEDPTGLRSDYYMTAKQAYEKVIKMDFSNNEKATAYYKLGVFYRYLNEKGNARQAFESALQLAETDRLASRIRSDMKTQ